MLLESTNQLTSIGAGCGLSITALIAGITGAMPMFALVEALIMFAVGAGIISCYAPTIFPMIFQKAFAGRA